MADTYWPSLRLLTPIITLMLLSTLIWQLFQANTKTPTVDWALTLAGGLYIGWGMAHLTGMRLLANGQAWIWLTLLCTWSIDTFAYLVGRKIGEHKLWPRLSPKKSWEGFFAGVVGSLAAAFLVAAVFGTPSWTVALLVGLIMPVVDLFGDVSISMMKREVGVKDSSNLFPGHGGFLDRIDSLLMDSIVVYYIAVWLG
jgi:phosphatidate cytidylyltransferase